MLLEDPRTSHQAAREARDMYLRVLRGWASDVLSLKSRGLHRPRLVSGASPAAGPRRGPPGFQRARG